MSVPFRTRDHLYRPPADRPKRRIGHWLVVFVLCTGATVALWLNRSRMRLASQPPTGGEVSTPDGALHGSDQQEGRPESAAPAPHAEPERVESPSAQPVATGPESPNADQRPLASSVRTVPPIGAQLKQGTDFFEVILRVPPDEQSHALRTDFAARTEVEVAVRTTQGETGRIGAAGVTGWRQELSSPDVEIVLHFDQSPAVATLVRLANARLSRGSELVIVRGDNVSLRYPFFRGDIGIPDTVR